MKTVHQLMVLKGRVALITGGAGHLGYAMAQAMAQAGASVILLDSDAASAKHKANALAKKYKVKTHALVLDLTDTGALSQVVHLIQKQTNCLDILINCAALVGTSGLKGWAVPFAQQNVDTWRLAMEVNLTSVFTLVQQCVPLIKKNNTYIIVI